MGERRAEDADVAGSNPACGIFISIERDFMYNCPEAAKEEDFYKAICSRNRGLTAC